MGKTPEEVKAEALTIAKEEIRQRLRAFSKTPVGKVFREAGNEVTKAREEGRELGPYDLAAFCMIIPGIMSEAEQEEQEEQEEDQEEE